MMDSSSPCALATTSFSPSATTNGAILVDSLLCFISNFRRHPQLQSIVLRHFSSASLRHSLRLLSLITAPVDQPMPPINADLPSNEEELFRTLLLRLDQLCACGQSPVFAAADLLCLPFRPLFDDDSLQIEDELRQIRFLLQDWLLRRDIGSSLPNSSSATLIPPSSPPSNQFATSSPEFPPPPNRPVHQQPPKSPSSPNQQQPPIDSSPFTSSNGHSPTKGHRILQVLQKLSRGKETTEGEMTGPRGMAGEEEEEGTTQMTTKMATAGTTPSPAPVAINSALAFMQMQIFRQAFANGILQQKQQKMEREEAKGRMAEEDGEEEADEDVEEGKSVDGDVRMEEENGGPDGEEAMPPMSASPAAFSEGGISSGRETAHSRAAEMEDEGGAEEKPFYCPMANCQKRFANKFLLKKHQFIHSGQKPHICQFCKKPFNRKDNLLRHKKTHLQNGMMATMDGTKRRHNMLRGITEQMAIEMQLLPLGWREGRQQKGTAGGAGKMKNGGGEQANQQEKDGEQRGEEEDRLE